MTMQGQSFRFAVGAMVFADSNAHPPHNVHNVHDAVFVVSGKALIKTNTISQRQVPLPFLLLHGCIQYVLNKPSIVATLLYTAHKCVFMLLLLPASQLFSLTAFYVGCSGTNLLFMEGSIIVFCNFSMENCRLTPIYGELDCVQTGGLGQVPLLLKVVKDLWLWSSVVLRSLCPGFGELRSQPHVHCSSVVTGLNCS